MFYLPSTPSMHWVTWFHQKHLIHCSALSVHSSGKPPWHFLISLWIFPGIYVGFGAVSSPLYSAIIPAPFSLCPNLSAPEWEAQFPTDDFLDHSLGHKENYQLKMDIISFHCHFSCGSTRRFLSQSHCPLKTQQDGLGQKPETKKSISCRFID